MSTDVIYEDVCTVSGVLSVTSTCLVRWRALATRSAKFILSLAVTEEPDSRFTKVVQNTNVTNENGMMAEATGTVLVKVERGDYEFVLRAEEGVASRGNITVDVIPDSVDNVDAMGGRMAENFNTFEQVGNFLDEPRSPRSSVAVGDAGPRSSRYSVAVGDTRSGVAGFIGVTGPPGFTGVTGIEPSQVPENWEPEKEEEKDPNFGVVGKRKLKLD